MSGCLCVKASVCECVCVKNLCAEASVCKHACCKKYVQKRLCFDVVLHPNHPDHPDHAPMLLRPIPCWFIMLIPHADLVEENLIWQFPKAGCFDWTCTWCYLSNVLHWHDQTSVDVVLAFLCLHFRHENPLWRNCAIFSRGSGGKCCCVVQRKVLSEFCNFAQDWQDWLANLLFSSFFRSLEDSHKICVSFHHLQIFAILMSQWCLPVVYSTPKRHNEHR